MPSQKSVTLTLRNPSPYARDGFVVRSWTHVARLLGGRPRAARVFREVDGKEKELPAQVDFLDDDPEHAQLVFSLGGPLSAGDEHYGTACGVVRVEAADENEAHGAAVAETHFTGVKLRNDFVELWALTSKKLDEKLEHDFYASSVRHVHLLKHEFENPLSRGNRLDALEAPGSEFTWDRWPEQRAMQIDRIHLVRPMWDERGSVDVFPYKNHWQAKQTSQGAVRATATLVSAPFEFECKDAGGTRRTFDCTVHRVLSLYGGEEFIGDQVWVEAADAKAEKKHRAWFSAGYFMRANFTTDKGIFRYPDHPGWLTIYSPHHPRQGYAFATDARATALWNPPLDYPFHDEKRAFSWEIGPTRVAHSFHAFRANTDRKQLSDLAGILWYRFAFKRIRATLPGEK